MPVPDSLLPTALTDVPAATVAQYDAVVAGMAAEFSPAVDATRGAVYDLVLRPAAVLAAAGRQAVDAVWDAMSPATAAAAPADAVDQLAAVYRVARRAATAAAGAVTLVLSAAVPTTVEAGAAVTAGGQAFEAVSTISARVTAVEVVGANDRLLVATAAGDAWTFDVPVTAVVAGAAGNVRRGVAATVALPPAALADAYMAADAVGGADAETNDALVARLAVGLAGRGWSSRLGVAAALADETTLAGLSAVSVIGFGDAEMARDRRTPWPVSTGGRIDVFVRTGAGWQTVAIPARATLVSVASTVGTWRLTLASAWAAGLYDVTAVVPAGATTPLLAPTVETRSFDAVAAAADGVDVRSAAEAAYSAYQTVTLTFDDASFDATDLTPDVSTRNYDVIARVAPLVAEAQAFLADRANRPPAGDALALAGTPLFVSVALTVTVPRAATADADAVAAAVAAAVNALGFAARVPASAVVAAALAASPAGAAATGVDLYGRLRRPDGVWVVARSPAELVVPLDPAGRVSVDTVAPTCSADDVTVTVVSL